MTEPEWQSRMEKLLEEYSTDGERGLYEELVTERDPISTWEEFASWLSQFPRGSCFRGQKDAAWQVIPTLDRKSWVRTEINAAGVRINTYAPLNMQENEGRMLNEFQRGAHHYHEITPPISDRGDWLAMMQHYGAPTRLLDWTRSPYVALYFALREDWTGDSTIWAIDLNWLRERSDELLRLEHPGYPSEADASEKLQYLNNALTADQSGKPIIVHVEPRQLNQRMISQQGELLYTLHNWIPFPNTLLSMLIHPRQVGRPVISRVILKREKRIELLDNLRLMNIHEASLFPGLDGFARSLGYNLDISLPEQIAEQEREDAKGMESLMKRRENGKK